MKIKFTMNMATEIIVGSKKCPSEVVYHPIRRIGNRTFYSEFWHKGKELSPGDIIETNDSGWEDWE